MRWHGLAFKVKLMVFSAFPIITSQLQTIPATDLSVAKQFVQLVGVLLFVAYSLSVQT
jgi:hypothetical protein